MPLYVGDDGGHDHRVSRWLKSEGDVVAPDEAVCEIETTEFLYDFGTDEEGYLSTTRGGGGRARGVQRTRCADRSN